MTLRVLLALVLGLACGVGAAALGYPRLLAVAFAVEPVGTVWTNAIRMTVVPLVVALIITGVAEQADLRRIGRLGGLAFAVFAGLLLAAGLFAVLVAPPLLGGLTIAPSAAESLRAGASASAVAVAQVPSLSQRLVETVPVNPIKAAADGALLPLVVFTLLFAAALTRLEAARREPVVRFFQGVGEAMLVLVGWVLLLAPVGIFALAVGLGARLGLAAVGALVQYLLVLSGVLIVLALAMYPVAWLAGGVPLRRFAAAAGPAQAVAFSSRSSLAALPALMAGARDGIGAPPAIVGFVLPLAVSVFRVTVPPAWVVGALFLGRLYGVDLPVAALVGLVVTATLISFSVPGIPSASLFLLSPVLVSLGLPAEGVGILIAVDVVPDLFKTTANVTGHLTAAAVVGRLAPSRAPSTA